MNAIPDEKTTQTTRYLLLFTGVVGIFTFPLIDVPLIPFPPEFFVVSLISGLIHFFCYLFLKRWTHRKRFILSIIDIVLLGFVIHYTGGILSPFSFIFFCILVTLFAHGVNPILNLVLIVITYLFVVAGEYFHVFPPIPLSNEDVYASGVTFSVIVIATMGFMIFSGLIYKVIVELLKMQVQEDQVVRQSILRKLSNLEAPSQVGLLVNKIVHDLRGPLGAIGGFIETIKEDNPLNSESNEDCEIMKGEIKRIMGLLDRLIKYVRPGQVEKELICPVDLVETVLSVLNFYPGVRQIRFEKFFPPQGKLKIHANKEEMQQVLFNILKNSIEAFEGKNEPRNVTLEVRELQAYVCIFVRDNGCGIPRQVIKKTLQEPFSSKKNGAGVGLLIAKEIVEAHGGRLEIESEEGKGTIVTIKLPLHQAVPKKVVKKGVVLKFI